MHSLEPELRELHSAGVIDDATASRAIALDSGLVFSLFQEVRATLYGAVALIVAPRKSFSGKFVVRVPPELHERATEAAAARRVSLNELVKAALERETADGVA